MKHISQWIKKYTSYRLGDQFGLLLGLVLELQIELEQEGDALCV